MVVVDSVDNVRIDDDVGIVGGGDGIHRGDVGIVVGIVVVDDDDCCCYGDDGYNH